MKTDILYPQEAQEIMGFICLGKKITGKLRTLNLFQNWDGHGSLLILSKFMKADLGSSCMWGVGGDGRMTREVVEIAVHWFGIKQWKWWHDHLLKSLVKVLNELGNWTHGRHLLTEYFCAFIKTPPLVCPSALCLTTNICIRQLGPFSFCPLFLFIIHYKKHRITR